jgi:hypothetical protein
MKNNSLGAVAMTNERNHRDQANKQIQSTCESALPSTGIPMTDVDSQSNLDGARLSDLDPSVIGPLKLPAHLHEPALTLLNKIAAAETIIELVRVHSRADGYVYGLIASKSITENVSGRLWLVYARAQEERLFQLKCQQIA